MCYRQGVSVAALAWFLYPDRGMIMAAWACYRQGVIMPAWVWFPCECAGVSGVPLIVWPHQGVSVDPVSVPAWVLFLYPDSVAA